MHLAEHLERRLCQLGDSYTLWSDNELDKPNGVAVRRERQIYVADQGNRRVQILNGDLTYKGTCSFPDHAGIRKIDIYSEKIAIYSAGYIYVTDSKNTCVYVFNESGQFHLNLVKSSSKDRGNLSS